MHVKIFSVILKVSILSTVFLFFSCTKSGVNTTEESSNNFMSGKRSLKEGMFEDALNYFFKVIQNFENSPKSHFEIGNIYLDFYNDPIFAIYHFRQSILHSSNDNKTEDKNIIKIAESKIETAKKEFLKQLPIETISKKQNSQNQLIEILKHLRKENKILKNEIIELKNNNLKINNSFQKPHGLDANYDYNKKGQKEARYLVVPGDTLAKISQKVYDSPNLWKIIFKANKSILKTPNSLQINQVLAIPEKDSNATHNTF